jgi:hypothetical protein
VASIENVVLKNGEKRYRVWWWDPAGTDAGSASGGSMRPGRSPGTSKPTSGAGPGLNKEQGLLMEDASQSPLLSRELALVRADRRRAGGHGVPKLAPNGRSGAAAAGLLA